MKNLGYSLETENSYQIQWIYGEELKHSNNVTLLLLGGSGAGKSSFAKDFAYHGNQISSTSDGQTTRTKVIYNYKILNERDNIKSGYSDNIADIKILTKEEFTDRMIEKVGQRPALLMSQVIFQLENESIKDNIIFLENCYSLLQLIKSELQPAWWPNKMLDDIRAGIHHLLSNKKMIKCYEDIIETLYTYFDVSIIKYLLDEHCILKFREDYQQNKQKSKDFKSEGLGLSEFEKELLNIEAVQKYYEASVDNLDIQFKEFQREAVKKLFNKKKSDGTGEENAISKLEEKKFCTTYLDSLFSVEGYFALEEFYDIFPEKDQKEWLDGLDIYKREFVVNNQMEPIAIDWIKGFMRVMGKRLRGREMIWQNVFHLLRLRLWVH